MADQFNRNNSGNIRRDNSGSVRRSSYNYKSSSSTQKKKKKAPKSFRTLIPLLSTYIGVRVTIELKNDTEIIGILDEVLFPSMNIVLVDANILRTTFEFNSKDYNGDTHMWLGKSKSFQSIIQRATQSQIHVDRTFVHGSTIRYVHFPDHVNVSKQLAKADKITQSSKQLYERGVRPDKQ
jgi:small nuclear ribonucleoprotein (snRNP)-like protein